MAAMSGAYWLGVATPFAVSGVLCAGVIVWAHTAAALSDSGFWCQMKVRNLDRISDFMLTHNIWWERSFGPVFVGGWYRETGGRELASRWLGIGRANGRCLLVGRKREVTTAAPTAPPANGEQVRGGWGGEAQRGLRGAQGRSEGLGEGE